MARAGTSQDLSRWCASGTLSDFQNKKQTVLCLFGSYDDARVRCGSFHQGVHRNVS